MKPFSVSHCIAMLSLLCGFAARAQIATFGPPAVPSMDDAVITAGTSVVGDDGQNWAYVVWRSPGVHTLKNKAFAVYLQSTPGGSFVRQAIVAPTSEPPALNLLLQRAFNLHADNGELDEDLRLLLRRKSWAGVRMPDPAAPANGVIRRDLEGSPFDNKPLVEKLSACMGHAIEADDAFASLNLIAPEHPALRMAIGRAWAGVLPPGGGPMVVELREWNGADGAVIGRVSLTPGQGITLTSPGKIVQVPDLKPSGDLSIKLRWAVPDAMRRQQQHILGFKVYRVFVEDAAGLTLNSTPSEIASWASSHPNDVKKVNEAPVPIGTLFDDFSVNNFYPAGGDRGTYFLADDNNAGAPVDANQPNGFRRLAFHENIHAYYFVSAVDLLGHVGPPSTLCEGITARTVPPDVPGGLTVTDAPLADGTRQFVLRWKANGVPQGVTGRTTQTYAIYRGDVPQVEGGMTSLLPLENPNQFKLLTPIAYVSQSQAQDGFLSFTDNTITKTSANTDRSIWYAVTALHDTALDWWAAPPYFVEVNPHERVQSAPSPPAFGVFRDCTGPDAPTGSLAVNCDRLVCVSPAENSDIDEVRTPTSSSDNYQVHFRTVVKRPNNAIRAVRIVYYDLGPGDDPNGLVGDSLGLLFPPESNEITHEISLPKTWADHLYVTCFGITPDGSFTNVGTYSYRGGIEPDATKWHRVDFTVGRFALSDFASDSNSIPGIKNTAQIIALSMQGNVGPGVKKGNLTVGLPDGQMLVLQRKPELFGDWSTVGTTVVKSNSVLIPFDPAVMLLYQYRVGHVTAGLAATCIHNPRPPEATEIQPVTISVNLPATTKEWRVYRSVDAGPMALIKSGIIDLNQGVADAIIAQDKTMPPNGALMRYFAQCFDQNNNPSPLKFLGEVSLLPAPAVPLLGKPETFTGDDVERVRLKWFCPSPGVKRFEIVLTALTKSKTIGKPLIVSSGITPQVYGTISNEDTAQALINLPHKLAGDTSGATKTVPIYYTFLTPELRASDTSPMHEAVFTVKTGTDYLAMIQVIGTDDLVVNSSKAYVFQWQSAPQTAGNSQEPLVPWPARPLPPVVPNPWGSAYLMSSAFNPNGTPVTGFDPSRSSISNVTAASLYPVGVTIGLLPGAAELRDDSLSDSTGLVPPISFDSIEGPLANPPPDKPTDPANYAPGMLACVLYRQTLLANDKPGALVQVSPLRETIAWKRETEVSQAAGLLRYHSLLRDPFVKVLTYEFGPAKISYLSLVDTHSVEAGARYHYYLATYETNGELKTVYDCGIVTIPED